jgi:XTP/dITP diphosphohydrolase
MQLVFASNNKNKIKEIQLLLPQSIQILSLEDIGSLEDIPETAYSIEGNAILKANYVTQNYGYNCFADDTGLEVDALNGVPGVYSARYAGEQKDANDNMDKLLANLAGKMINSAKVQVEYYSIRNEAPVIKFLESTTGVTSE